MVFAATLISVRYLCVSISVHQKTRSRINTARGAVCPADYVNALFTTVSLLLCRTVFPRPGSEYVTDETDELIDWKVFGETRNLLGAGFMRVLGYFREDGAKSVVAIEEAMRLKDSTKLVMPAHTLKGEAWQFGGYRLALLAEEIEVAARHYVEIQIDPSELVEQVVRLRPMFEATLLALESETNPLVERRAVAAAQRNALGGMRFS
jgi:HPt (histidine-containing phosphotransfer) domain-containing protein